MHVLQKSKLFGGLLAEELQALEQTAQLVGYKARQTIFTEGSPGDGLYVVDTGLVQISALVHEQERRVLARIAPGDFFGEMAVLDNEARSATAIAEQDTTVYFITRQDLLNLLNRSPLLATSLMREFSRRMREINRQYVQEVIQAERLTLVGRFARTIIHDFKNPLNVIGLAAELASMDGATADMRQTSQKRIQRQIVRLNNMMNELLEFTRGPRSNMMLAETDYASYIHQLLEELRPEVRDKSVELFCENDPPSVKLQLSPHRLTHLFYNLVHNAMDEMPAGGRIMLRFRQTEKEVVTEVEDTGKGIAPEIAGRLFEPFATHGKAQGTGLGLSICKKIIEDHRGRIEARSAPGRGALFCLTLPLAR